MDAHQVENLRKVLDYGESSEDAQKAYVQNERNRIARLIREARERVKANKAAHGGIYVGA